MKVVLKLSMAPRLSVALAAILAFQPRQAIADVKEVRQYSLHLPHDRRRLFEMAVTPGQDVLSFIANADGKWRFSRIRGWLENVPHEETITVPGLSLTDHKWLGAWNAEILLTADGKFAVCIAYDWYKDPRIGRENFVSVVDLLEFKLVTNIRASEVPALGGDYRTYHLDRGGYLAVQAFTPFPRQPGDDITSGASNVKLALLPIPDLIVAGACRYAEFIRNGRPPGAKGRRVVQRYWVAPVLRRSRIFSKAL